MSQNFKVIALLVTWLHGNRVKSELAQLNLYDRTKYLCMIILERSTSIVFPVHSLSSLKKFILHD